ncbi:Hypothetical protein PFR_JS21-2_1477 [Propionibacterium freudenreichii]|nr:Hypothetical protein PFR_JS4_1162 [Propionibacterium freudenreichii]SCQ56638.1 Hypothetical protein PFR_JS21-1_1478 [Propionibacterium freudenreichii]SCQ59034.1 Hypothetical protein PFR_JS25-1_1343 [Propionibacterium freudenreichii]SCQ63561.1 Hypothetical protein PFR_JS21-2_1477 [Propionibacterium freudenreichii]
MAHRKSIEHIGTETILECGCGKSLGWAYVTPTGLVSIADNSNRIVDPVGETDTFQFTCPDGHSPRIVRSRLWTLLGEKPKRLILR